MLKNHLLVQKMDYQKLPALTDISLVNYSLVVFILNSNCVQMVDLLSPLEW